MATLFELQQGLVNAHNSGKKEDAQVFADSIREHPTFQKQSQDKLSQGFKALSGDERKAQIAKHTARSLGIKEADLDAERGMGMWGRAKLAFQPTPQDKFKSLEDTYGRENLKGVNIAGETQFLYRDKDETGNKWRRVDEQGASLADFTSDLAGAVPVVAASIAGGIKGAAVGGAAGLAAGGVGAIPGAIAGGVIGAAGGGFAASSAQDVAVRSASGEDIQLGEIAGRRGKEALVGAAIDTATLGAGRFIAKPLMKAVGKTPMAQGIMDSVGSLQKKFNSPVTELPEMTKSLKGMETAARRSGETGGAMTRARQANIDEIGRISKVIAGEEAPTTASQALRKMKSNISEGYSNDIAEAKKMGKEIETIYRTKADMADQSMRTQLESELAGIKLPKDYDPELAGVRLQEAVSRQFDIVRDATKKKYEAGLVKMEQSGTSIGGDELADAIARASKKSGGVENIEGDLVEALSSSTGKQLERSISKHLEDLADSGAQVSYREVHDVVQKFKGKMNFNPAQTPSTEQLAAKFVVDELTPLLKTMRGKNPVADKAISQADEFFKERNLPFRNKDIAPLIKRDVSKQFEKAGENVATTVFNNSRNVRNLLNNAGGLKNDIKKTLSNMYLDAIGNKLDFNPRIAELLFDKDKVAALGRIKRLRERLDVSKDIIKGTDVESMVNGLSGKARKEAEEALTKKIKAEHRANSLIESNKLVRKIATGKAPLPSDPRGFADSVMKENSDTIRKFMDVVSKDPDSELSFRAGVTNKFLDLIGYGGDAAQRTSVKAGESSLWKAGTIEAKLTGSTKAKYEAAMGKDWVKDWIDLDRALKGSEITGTKITEQVRAVFTTGSGLLIVAAGVPKWAYSRALNALGGSKIMRPFIRNVEQDPSVMQDLIPYMLGTAEGLEALMTEAKEDPDFAEFLDNQLVQQQ